jgi:hypothetical protein
MVILTGALMRGGGVLLLSAAVMPAGRLAGLQRRLRGIDVDAAREALAVSG